MKRTFVLVTLRVTQALTWSVRGTSGTWVALVGAWLAAACMALSAEVAPEAPPILRAGTAKKDITPAQPVKLEGYGSRKDLSQGVHDPLSARAVAFQQDGQRLVLVSTDICGFYGGAAPSMRKAILAECGLRPSELFLAAVHTHSGPTLALERATEDGGRTTEGGDGQRVTAGSTPVRRPSPVVRREVHPNNVQYTKTLQTQLVAVVREALAHPVPVRIEVGSGSSPVGANRREYVRDAAGKVKVRLGRNPDRPTDHEVQVLEVLRTGDGGPAAVIFAYATHSTTMGPHNYLISGDVHGLAEQFLEQYFAAGLVAPGFAGASGNVDPWFRVLPKFRTDKGWIPEAVLLGTMLGEEVVHVSDRGLRPTPSGPIRTAFRTLDLPRQPRAVLDGTGDDEPPEFNLTVGRLGDVAVVGLGGEVFNETGKAIKAASPFPHTFIITHCNGTAGYMPTADAYPEGGYEVESSQFAPAAADQLVQEAARLLREIRR
ncbi:MAG: hypothetical protein ABSF26_15285 [Thermoguttaceae bacterium]